MVLGCDESTLVTSSSAALHEESSTLTVCVHKVVRSVIAFQMSTSPNRLVSVFLRDHTRSFEHSEHSVRILGLDVGTDGSVVV